MSDVLHIRRAVAVLAGTEEETLARLEVHRDTLPRAQGRRMSPHGLAVDLTLTDDPPAPDDPLVYVSRYAMSRALEDFLGSFPHPSPLAFQNAIHPAGVEQFLVPRKLVVRELMPLATDDETGMAPALRAIFLSPGDTRRLVGGEECGTWLTDSGAASDRTFAFAVTFATAPSADDIGTLTRDAFSVETAPLAPLAFAEAVAKRAGATVAVPGFGRFTLAWK